MTRAEHGRSVQRELIDAGLRPDDAVVAAEVFDRVYRDRRDAAIKAARKAGLSVRQIARLFGLHFSQVSRITSGSVVVLHAPPTHATPKSSP